MYIVTGGAGLIGSAIVWGLNQRGIRDILVVARGVDMFDCVMPTRNGRNGMLFTSNGIINIKNEKWKYDFSPLDENGTTYVDRDYSKAYLRHLIISKEILGPMIATVHNLGFYLWLVKEARKHIIQGDFYEQSEAGRLGLSDVRQRLQ